MENVTVSSETQPKSTIENEFENLNISALSESYLMTSAKWCKFLAIVGFILIGFMLVAGVGIASVSGIMSEYQQPSIIPMAGVMSFMWIFYIILALLYFFPTYYLLLFANKTKQALIEKNPVTLEEGFKNMKKLSKFVGIVTIVILAIYPIAIFAFVIGDFMNK